MEGGGSVDASVKVWVGEESNGYCGTVATPADWAGGARNGAVNSMGAVVPSYGGRGKEANRKPSEEGITEAQVGTALPKVQIHRTLICRPDAILGVVRVPAA
jgi:hypothetical protein